MNREWESKSLAGTLKSVDTYSFEAGYAEGYRVALERISNLRDIEKTQQELSDMTQRHNFLMGMLKRLVHDRFYPGSGVWAEAEEICQYGGEVKRQTAPPAPKR